MTPKTLSLNIELCDSGAIISYPDDGCKYAYSDETEACRRFECYVIWEKAKLNNNAFFTIEHYNQNTGKCKLYIPIEQ